jgi:hypothetical protein
VPVIYFVESCFDTGTDLHISHVTALVGISSHLTGGYMNWILLGHVSVIRMYSNATDNSESIVRLEVLMTVIMFFFFVFFFFVFFFRLL